MTHPTAQPMGTHADLRKLLNGQLLPTSAGRARISLQQVRPGVFNITTQQGTQRIAEWSCSYDNAATALAERDRAALAFMHHRTADAIAAECNRLADAIEARRRRRANADDLRVELAAVQPLTAAARDADLAARILGTVRHAAVINTLPEAERADAWEAARDSFEASRLPVQPVGLPRRNTIQPSN